MSHILTKYILTVFKFQINMKQSKNNIDETKNDKRYF